MFYADYQTMQTITCVLNRKNKVIFRRHHNEKYHSHFIVPRLQGGSGSVDIWGCITFDGPCLHMLYDGQHR